MAPLAHMLQWQIMTPLKTAQPADAFQSETLLAPLKSQQETLGPKPINQVVPQAANSNMLQDAVAHLAPALKKRSPRFNFVQLSFSLKTQELLFYNLFLHIYRNLDVSLLE